MSPDRSQPIEDEGAGALEARLRRAEEAARYWQVEATMRATTVAGTLTMQILAAEKLASAVESTLGTDPLQGLDFDRLRVAVTLYRKIQAEQHARD